MDKKQINKTLAADQSNAIKYVLSWPEFLQNQSLNLLYL